MIVEYIHYKLPERLNAQFEADYVKAAEFLKASSLKLNLGPLVPLLTTGIPLVKGITQNFPIL